MLQISEGDTDGALAVTTVGIEVVQGWNGMKRMDFGFFIWLVGGMRGLEWGPVGRRGDSFCRKRCGQ